MQVAEWTKKIRKETSALDRQIRSKSSLLRIWMIKCGLVKCVNEFLSVSSAIQREEDKIKRSLKEAAKKGDKDVCLVYAKELVRSKKAISKIYTSKAHLNSISLHMKEQLGIVDKSKLCCTQDRILYLMDFLYAAMLKTAGSLQKSTQVMQSVQALFRIPEMAATMRELSKEMMRAGLLEEMMEETFEGLEDTDDIEEAEDEVQGVSE